MGPKLRSSQDEMKELETQFKLLENINNQVLQALQEDKHHKIKRLKQNMGRSLEIVSDLVNTISENKVKNGEDSQEIITWKNQQEELLEQYENTLEDIEQHFNKQIKTNTQSEVTEETKSNEQQREWMQEQRQWMLDQQIAMNKQMVEISMRSSEREEAWYMKRMDMEKELAFREASRREERTQSVKLQRYTITKFNGDFKDWLRFWNQFMVEIDGSKIPCISKFNYLLELVEGQPKDDILGLPHTIEGYEEAKQILRETYGKDIKVRKALIQDNIRFYTR